MDTLRGTQAKGAYPYEWDVALSFAGAQRPYVEQVARALKSAGVRCFYDADEQTDLWGKCLTEVLPAIYADRAATVIVFVSAEYAAREWTRVERRAALTRASREPGEYLLPARFDDTALPGLLTDLVTIDLRTHEPQEFAAIVLRKLAALGITQKWLGYDAVDSSAVRPPETDGGGSAAPVVEQTPTARLVSRAYASAGWVGRVLRDLDRRRSISRQGRHDLQLHRLGPKRLEERIKSVRPNSDIRLVLARMHADECLRHRAATPARRQKDPTNSA